MLNIDLFGGYRLLVCMILIFTQSSFIVQDKGSLCVKRRIKSQVNLAVKNSGEDLIVSAPINVDRMRSFSSPEMDFDSMKEIKYIIELRREKDSNEKIVLYYSSDVQLVIVYLDSNYPEDMKLFDFLPRPIYE